MSKLNRKADVEDIEEDAFVDESVAGTTEEVCCF